jgi:hypothetical protein
MHRSYLIGAALFLLVISLRAQTTPSLAKPEDNTILSDSANDGLPSWVRVGAEYRARVEGFTGGGFKPGNDDAYLLSRVRINMFILPTNWLKFGLQGQDAHAFWKNQTPLAPPYQDAMDLRQAYAELGDMEKDRMAIRAGRQELAFGDERLMGNSNWTNTARSFDGLRGSIRRGGLHADLFAARVVKLQDGEFDWSTPGNNLYGIYGGADHFIPKATVEPYFFWRRQSGLRTETGAIGISNFGTVGVRWVGKLPRDFDYATEMDKQAGSLGTDTISAWAGHWVLGKTLTNVRFAPRFSAEYNFASGDRNRKDGVRGTFDQLYPTAHDKYGLADQVGWKNIRNARAGVDLKLAKKWKLTARYDAWWLADPHDALYSATSTVVAQSTAGTAGRFVGQELDSVLGYSPANYIQVSGGYGHIFPGTFLNHTTPGQSYNFPYAMTTFIF